MKKKNQKKTLLENHRHFDFLIFPNLKTNKR